MSNDKSRKPSWRSEVPKKDKKQEARPAWQREAEVPTEVTPRWNRKTKIGVGVFGFLAFNALLIWVIYWLWPPKPSCLVLLGAGYEDNLAVPHNVYGSNGLESLAEVARGGSDSMINIGSGLLRLKHDPRELKQGDEWDRGLDDFKERTVLIYLAMHGGADADGPYLLRQDSDYKEPSKLRLGAVLDVLRDKVPPEKKKVLILDATQVPADWSLGMLQNGFARALNDLSKQIEAIPNLVVLSASDADERSWGSEELRKTVFTHFVIEGLKGAADNDHNGRVDAQELHEYVKRNVSRWARANRAARQTPVLLGGAERAREIEIVVVKDEYQAPNYGEIPAFAAPPELTQGWEQAAKLATQVPAPAAYAPQMWRQYLDLLIRYEQLLRAGDQRRAPDVKRALSNLEEDLARAQRLELRSADNSLAMPDALGQTSPLPESEIAKHFSALWSAKPEEVDKVWEKIQQSAGDNRARALLRMRLCGELLQRAADAPRENLEKAVILTKNIGLYGNNRPVEAHFAAMLLRDLDKQKPPDEELVARALRMRRLAESVALALQLDNMSLRPRGDAHPYSEEVFPWVREKVEKADALRRTGEDRILATDRESWNQSGDDLRKAETGYLDARADADKVRAALLTRDEVLAALPYYSHWMARRRAVEESELRALEDQVKSLETLWREAHYLARLVETPDARRINEAIALDGKDIRPRSVSAQADLVKKTFDELELNFERHCNELSGAALQSVWRDTDDALVVPRIKPSLRIKLLTNARAISQSIFVKSSTDPSDPAPMSEERNAELARRAAQREGRMALAVLGQAWFDDDSLQIGRASEKYGDVENRIKNFVTEEKGPASLLRAGEEVGLRWRKIPEQANRRTDEARKSELKIARTETAAAARIARLADGASATSFTVNPADELRRLHTYDLLLWQAERIRQDHWFAEEPSAEPYYLASGMSYVLDSRNLMRAVEGNREHQQRLAEAGRMEQELQKPGKLVARGPVEAVEVTSEPSVEIEYQLEPEVNGWVPAGYPALWLETGKFLQADAKDGRRVIDVSAKRPMTFRFQPNLDAEPPKRPRRDETKAVLSGRFRGQVLAAVTPIYVHRLPETVVYHQPSPPRAGLAVRAAPNVHNQFAPEKGALAIILDCSGSMMRGKVYSSLYEKLGDKAAETFLEEYNEKTVCNYHDATGALKAVLAELPDGVRISIYAFSHSTSKESNRYIELIRKPSPWSKDELKGTMSRLEKLKPYYDTPIVHSMLRVRDEGFPENFKGFKSMIVLTDGEDTEFAKDAELVRKYKNIPTLIREEFKDFDVTINVVGFRVTNKQEEKNFRAQFEEPIKKLTFPGKFYTTDDAAALADRLKRAVRQTLRFKIETEEGQPMKGMPEDGWVISRNDQANQWIALEPGSYVVKVQTNKVYKQTVTLRNGDFMIASLKEEPGKDGMYFERVLTADDNRMRPNQDNHGWHLTDLQNQIKRDSSLEMLLTLENRADRAPERGGTLTQVRPRLAWFEVKPQSSNERVAIRVGDVAGYAAPAWSVNVPFWPGRENAAEPAKPAVDVWWTRDFPETFATPVRRAAGTDLAAGFKGKVQVGAGAANTVEIEDVRIEERTLEAEPGTQRKVTCLVVRLSYPRGKPVQIFLDGIEAQGFEHHYYTQAGKYTAIFWEMNEDKARKLKGLQLVSLDKFKSDDTRTSHIELKFDETPNAEGRPPSIPESLPK
jgi:hypothetical protein